jgi:hypothetical protein
MYISYVPFHLSNSRPIRTLHRLARGRGSRSPPARHRPPAHAVGRGPPRLRKLASCPLWLTQAALRAPQFAGPIDTWPCTFRSLTCPASRRKFTLRQPRRLVSRASNGPASYSPIGAGFSFWMTGPTPFSFFLRSLASAKSICIAWVDASKTVPRYRKVSYMG